MKATLFTTCLGDSYFPEDVAAAVSLLRRLGHEVTWPDAQTCCGQPMFNAGHHEPSARVVRHFLDVFTPTGGTIVAPSSSCAAMVREHFPRLFRDDPARLAQAEALGRRTFELCEFLLKRTNFDPAVAGARFEGAVTCHVSCHYRALELGDAIADLVRRVPGVDYRPLDRWEECCGFGGTFALNVPHVSRAMVKAKVESISRTGAEWLVHGDPGCALNIAGYAKREGIPLKAIHVARFLDRALDGARTDDVPGAPGPGILDGTGGAS